MAEEETKPKKEAPVTEAKPTEAKPVKEAKAPAKETKAEAKPVEAKASVKEVKADAKADAKSAAMKALGKEEPKEEEKPKILKESVHTIGLRDAWEKPRTKRARAAINTIKAYVRKHTRKEPFVSTALNKIVWARGIQHPPRRVKVKILEEEKRATADVV